MQRHLFTVAGHSFSITAEVEIPEIFFNNYLRQLHSRQKVSELSTLNAVIDILSDNTTASHEIFKMYGVSVV